MTRRAAQPGARRTAQKKKPSQRRIGANDSVTKTMLVDAAQQLMLEEGYAAVTSRRIAAKAGLKPQLVHYYFRSMDDLFLAVLRQNLDQALEHQKQLLSSPRAARQLWEFNTRESQLIVELTALANHRPVIRAELAANAERFRNLQTEIVAQVGEAHGIDPEVFPPVAVVVLLTAVARILAMEQGLGITTGHAETLAFVERYLARADGDVRASRVKASRRS